MIEWVAWSDEYAARCPDCRETYRTRKPPQDPPCKQCRVELQGENEDAARVYMLTRGQVVTAGQGVVVDISVPAVKIAMDLLKVADQADCLNRVRGLFHRLLKEKSREG